MSWYAFLWLVPLLGPLHNWTVNDFGCWVSSRSLWLRLASLHTHYTVYLMHCFVPGICLCDICVFFFSPLGSPLGICYWILTVYWLLFYFCTEIQVSVWRVHGFFGGLWSSCRQCLPFGWSYINVHHGVQVTGRVLGSFSLGASTCDKYH